MFWLQRVHGPYHSFIFCKLSHYFLGGTGIPRRKRADLPSGAKNLSTTPAISFPKRLSLGHSLPRMSCQLSIKATIRICRDLSKWELFRRRLVFISVGWFMAMIIGFYVATTSPVPRPVSSGPACGHLTMSSNLAHRSPGTQSIILWASYPKSSSLTGSVPKNRGRVVDSTSLARIQPNWNCWLVQTSRRGEAPACNGLWSRQRSSRK